MARLLRGALATGAGLGVLTPVLQAQISPGKLSRPHAGLEGSTQCLSCHDARQGVAAGKCLVCHTLLRDRIGAGKGLHARGEYRDCKTCHVEHQGLEYELVFWGKPGRGAFDHRQTGYNLEGKHASLACDGCHRTRLLQQPAERLTAGGADPTRTFQALGTACTACHEDIHRGTPFGGKQCLSCHTQTAWKPASAIDHALTGFPLSGRHSVVACDKCHAGTSPAPPAPGATVRLARAVKGRDCVSCHEDVHQGRLGGSCATCHTTSSWRGGEGGVRARFDHDRTTYPLRGRHATVACASCHRTGQPMRVKHEACIDCHADVHLGQFGRRADKGRCEACHDVNGFMPARFAIEEHQKGPYPLAGAHLAIPCDACHRAQSPAVLARALGVRVAAEPARPTAQFRFASTRCADCHRDPHLGEVDKYAKKEGCEACHRVESWRSVRFDHGVTRFALSGGHAKPACSACHAKVDLGTPRARVKLAGLSLACEACHKDPHLGQFARGGEASSCERCHTTVDVRASKFDHQRDAAFSLDGAHIRVACAACHRSEKKDGVSFVRYTPVPKACKDCHAGNVLKGGAP